MVIHNKMYGHAFRKLRLSKGYSLSYFSRINISKATISDFENGRTIINIEKLDMMLNEMNVSLSEFDLLLNNYVPIFQEEFLLELEEADYHQNQIKIRKLYAEAAESFYKWEALAAKACLKELSQSDIDEISIFIRNIKEWGYFELTFAYFVVEWLKTDLIVEVMNDFERKNKNEYIIAKYRRRLFQIIYRIIEIFIFRDEESKARVLIKYVERYHHTEEFYSFILNALAKSFIQYRFEDKVEATLKINRLLAFLEEVDCHVMKKYYENKFNELKKVK